MKKKRKGFTLVELLSVLACLVLLPLVVASVFHFIRSGEQVLPSQQVKESTSERDVVNLPTDYKLVGATWQGINLWYLTRPMRPGELPETNLFLRADFYGRFKDKVTFRESSGGPLAEVPK